MSGEVSNEFHCNRRIGGVDSTAAAIDTPPPRPSLIADRPPCAHQSRFYVVSGSSADQCRTRGCEFDPQPGAWRNFQILTRIEIANADGKSQAWIPVPAVNELNWFKSLGNEWTSNGRATLIRDAKYGAEMLHVEWTDAEKSPVVEVTSRIATRDRAIDFAKPSRPAPLSAAELEINTKGIELLIPVDGIVKQASDKIVTKADAKTDIEKARAIYEWIVDNTFRDARVGGCGIGDIAASTQIRQSGAASAPI